VKVFPASKTKARFLEILQWGIVSLIFLFLGRMVWEDWTRVREASFVFKGAPLLWGTVLFVFSYFIQIWAWYLITVKVGIAISFRETLESWFYSQLGKYLPGKIWIFLGRFYLYGSKGKSKEGISIALYFETVTLTVAAGLLFLAALFFFKEVRPFLSGQQMSWLIFLFVVAFVSLYPPVLQTILNWFLIRFKRDPISLSIRYSDILCILFVCVLSWLAAGIAFYLFINSIFPVSSKYILYLTGSLAFACFLGLIVLIAPSGLGVREGVLVYFLSSVIPGPVAVILSVLTRLWTTLIEMGLIGVVYLFSRLRNRSEQRKKDVQT